MQLNTFFPTSEKYYKFWHEGAEYIKINEHVDNAAIH
jgi:hypothetical protein